MIDLQQLILQNRHLSEEVKRRVDQLAAINTVAASVSQSLDLNLTLQTALQAVLNITGAQAGGISLIDENTGELVLRAQQGWVRDFVKENPMRIPLDKQGMSRRVIASDDVIVNNDLNETEPLAVPRFHDEHFRSIAMAPMHARGKIIGILSIMSYKPDSFDESSAEVLRAIADTVGVALDNARLYEASIENQHRLSAVLHSTADGIIATEQNGLISLVNHAAENLLEVDAPALLGLPLREAPIQRRIRDSLLFAISSRSEECNKAFRVDTESGRVLSVLISPVYFESQVQQTATDGWVMVLQDVTHLREVEIARTQFIQAAAHDMRNPLGAALNSLSMLRRRINTPDTEVSEIIGIAENGISRIQDLIDDLLNLEQIQSGYGLNLEEVDIGELVYEVSAAVRPLMLEKLIDYHVDLQPGIPTLHIDRRWVTRAISNYLDNALKYTLPESQITLSLFVNEPMLHIEVSDNGPGIPVEQQARLFERFYRANTRSGIPGTGLGLAIVKSVAEAHGGGVYLQSSTGQGSVFGMTLLLARVEA